MTKNSNRVKTWRNNTKDRIIKAFGSSCAVCGYSRCNNALELHHLDPTEKEFSFGGIRANPKSWDKIVVELRKCMLLCANCHREYHAGILVIPDEIKLFNEEYADYRIPEGTHHICACGIIIPITKKFCSEKCHQLNRKTITNWEQEFPNIKKLKEVDKLTYVAIAKLYNTSDKTIAKWYKKLK